MSPMFLISHPQYLGSMDEAMVKMKYSGTFLWKLGIMIHEHNLVKQYTQHLGIVEY